MNIEKIKSKVDSYKKILDEVLDKRKYWVDVTKPLLQNTLSTISETFDIGWHSQTIDNYKNYEVVNLTLGSSSSGIFKITEESKKAFVKHGGTLVFGQSHSGNIIVTLLYPSIEDLVTPIESHKVIKEITPKEVTEDFIIEQVEKFLDEICKWEQFSPINGIGFKSVK